MLLNRLFIRSISTTCLRQKYGDGQEGQQQQFQSFDREALQQKVGDFAFPKNCKEFIPINNVLYLTLPMYRYVRINFFLLNLESR
jgi:hypothetical protein